MKNRRHFAFSLFTVIIITCFVWASPSAAKEKTKHTRELLEAIAQDTNIDVDFFEVVHEGIVSLPNIDGEYPTAKVINKHTGKRYEITIDDKGNKVDKEELIIKDNLIHKTKYGNLEPDLFEKKEELKDNETIDVAIWLSIPDEPIEPPSYEEFRVKGEYLVEMEMQAKIKEKKVKNLSHQEPIIKHLKNKNVSVISIDELLPIISARLDKEQLNEFSKRSDVEGVYLLRENQPALNWSVPNIGAPTFWGSGITGSAQKIAIIEKEGIVFDNPYLHGSNRPNKNCFGITNYHATIVSGVAANTSGYTGTAFNASLLGAASCSWLDADMQSATTWAYNNGAMVHNNSWGAQTSGSKTVMSKYQDTFVRQNSTTIIDAAGNCDNGLVVRFQCPNGCDCPTYNGCYVIGPANGYNVIAVGAYSDRNVVITDLGPVERQVTENTIPYLSCYANPSSLNGDREKPELVAPGIALTSTWYEPPWTMYGALGTSVSAPHVAGGAAMIMEKEPSLKFWPVGVKAVLMATAVTDFDGLAAPPFNTADSKDGAGGLSLAGTYGVLQRNNNSQWAYRSFTRSSFDTYGDINYSFYAVAGQKIRAAIAWDAATSYESYNSRPSVDLDLFVWSPSGANVLFNTFAGSFDNTSEIIDFVATETGNYTVEVYKWRYSYDATHHLGVAWYAR